MPSHPDPAHATNLSGLGWARRVLRQQLDALSRLAAVARRLIDPVAPAAQSASDPFGMAAIRGLEKTLRLHVRVTWAQRLIAALRAKLLADLQAVDNGQAPSFPVEAGSVDPDPERPAANEAPSLTDKKERPERGDRPDRERGFGGPGSDKELAEILKRPTVEIIALICRELGLPEDWPRLAEEAWAREQALVLRQAQDEDGLVTRAPQRTAPPPPTLTFSSS